MEVDVEIERISNGFIVCGIDSSGSKHYFESMEHFVSDRVLDPMKDADRYFREHDANGEKRHFKLTISST